MFKELKKSYGLDQKNYIAESEMFKTDINYLIDHYYRTRLNTKFDIVIVIPSLEDDYRNRLLQDMFTKSKVSWKENLHHMSEIIDLTDAIVKDIKHLTNGPRKKTVPKLKTLNAEIKPIVDLDLEDYLEDLFDNNETLIKEVKDLLDKNVISVVK